MQPYQIFARNIDETAGAFSLGQSYDLGADGVFAVGGPSSAMPLPGLAGPLFLIRASGGLVSLEVSAAAALPVQCNQASVPAGAVQPLLSGDEILAGGWAFRLVRRRLPAPFSPWADALAWVAKGLVAFLLVAEIVLVAVGPQRLQDRALFQRERELQKVEQALDHLVDVVGEARKRPGEMLPVERAAYNALGQELGRMKAYVRSHREQISVAQALELRERVAKAQGDYRLLQRRKLFAVPESPNVEEAVIRTLREARSPAPSSH